MKNTWIAWLIIVISVALSVAWVCFLSSVIVFLFGLIGVTIPMWVAFGILMLFEFLISAVFLSKK